MIFFGGSTVCFVCVIKWFAIMNVRFYLLDPYIMCFGGSGSFVLMLIK